MPPSDRVINFFAPLRILDEFIQQWRNTRIVKPSQIIGEDGLTRSSSTPDASFDKWNRIDVAEICQTYDAHSNDRFIIRLHTWRRIGIARRSFTCAR